MTGRHPQRSSGRRRLVLLVLCLVPLACTERGLGDDDAGGAIEHPPELLEQYELACEDWCALLDECGRDDIR